MKSLSQMLHNKEDEKANRPFIITVLSAPKSHVQQLHSAKAQRYREEQQRR